MSLIDIAQPAAQRRVDLHRVEKVHDASIGTAPRLTMVDVVPLPDAFHFEIQEEALDYGVVPAAATAAHACADAVGSKPLPDIAGVLVSTVRVQQQSLSWLALAQRYAWRITDETDRHPPVDRRADDLARVQIQRDSARATSERRRDVYDVRSPGLIRPGRREPAV